MNLPTRLTISRIILSPVFFLVWFIPLWTDRGYSLSAVILVVLFVGQEITDVLDGAIARKRGQVTDLGKVLDPFADVISRMTFFICFTGSGLMPIWILTILLYRELAITFLRLLMIRRGVALAASIWGKLKAVTYNLAGIVGLGVTCIDRFDILAGALPYLRTVSLYVFILAAAASAGSFTVYAVRAARDVSEDSGV